MGPNGRKPDELRAVRIQRGHTRHAEDSACGCDMNVVMTGSGRFVEVQGTAEGETFSREAMDALLRLAHTGIAQLVAHQKRAVGL